MATDIGITTPETMTSEELTELGKARILALPLWQQKQILQQMGEAVRLGNRDAHGDPDVYTVTLTLEVKRAMIEEKSLEDWRTMIGDEQDVNSYGDVAHYIGMSNYMAGDYSTYILAYDVTITED